MAKKTKSNGRSADTPVKAPKPKGAGYDHILKAKRGRPGDVPRGRPPDRPDDRWRQERPDGAGIVRIAQSISPTAANR